MLICDAEATGFVYDAEKIWVIAAFSLEENRWYVSFDKDVWASFPVLEMVQKEIPNKSFYLHTHKEMMEVLSSTPNCFHNAYGYDKLLFENLGYDYTPVYQHDSLVLSQLFNPDRLGGHGLAAWGRMFKRPKPEHEEWDKFSQEMLHRVIEDVRINILTWNALMKERKSWEKRGYSWNKSIKLEYAVADLMGRQARHGVLLDVERAYALADEIYKEIQKLDKYLLDRMPVNRADLTIVDYEKLPFTQGGKLKAAVIKWFKGKEVVGGPFCRVEYIPVNLNSHDQIKAFLLTQGWIPTEYTEKGSPQLTEDSYDSIKGALGQVIAKRAKLKHRAQTIFNITKKGELKGWLNVVRSDGRIEAGAWTNGTNCVTGDTEVVTKRGLLPIVEITVGDEVLTHTGAYSTVTDFISNGIKPVFEVKSDNGLSLTCTENHPFYTEAFEWVTAKDLELNTRVFNYQDKERWGQIDGLRNTYISSWGRVLSTSGKSRTVQTRVADSWASAAVDVVFDNGLRTKRSVASLVLEAFVGPRPKGREACHKDGIPMNNYLGNLYWGTSEDNSRDAKTHGRHLKAMRSRKNCKLTEENAKEIREYFEKHPHSYGSYKEIGDKYGVSGKMVSLVHKGMRWDPDESVRNDYVEDFGITAITSIEAKGEQPTYDITVAGSHSYVANGFVVHNTGRMRHFGLVNVPKPKDKLWDSGMQLRSLITVPKGRIMVGIDADGLEARVMCHWILPYPGGEEYAQIVLEGDIHVVNADIFEIDPALDHDERRDKSKPGYYCLMYGGQFRKLAATLECSEKKGKRLYDKFWRESVALGKFRDAITKYWKQNGQRFILGIDGRPIRTRSEHSLVNACFQSTGSIIVKKASVLCDQWVREEGLDAHQVIHYHDEFEYESSKKDAKRVGELMEKAMTEAGKFYKIRVPITGTAKFGKTWEEVH